MNVYTIFALAARTFPRDFRDKFIGDILSTAYSDFLAARATSRTAGFVSALATTWDLIRSGLKERVSPSWIPKQPTEETNIEVTPMVGHVLRDFKHAARALIRARGFTAVSVLTLALAIGANAAIFSVVDGVLVAPLPFDPQDRVLSIRASAPGSDFPEEFGLSSEFFIQYRDEADLLEDVGLYNSFGSTLQTDEFADRVRMATVTYSFFTTLAVAPHLGRLPTPTESNDVMLISHSVWVNRFGADPSIIGRAVEAANDTRTVIGVMPPSFGFPQQETSVWIPFVVEEADIVPGRFFWQLIAKPRPNTSVDEIRVQLTNVASRLPERFGGSQNYARLIQQHRPVIRPLKDYLVGDVARPLWILFGTATVVFLIACSNIANLFLVRSDSRLHDFAIRGALGANRWRLMSIQMSEALVLGGLGGVGGVLLAIAGVPALTAAAPGNVPGIDGVSVDVRTLIFTTIIAITAALVCGLIPALKASSPTRTRAIRHAGRGGVNLRPKHMGRDVLVVAQTALALVLLVGSGLLVRSFMGLKNVDPGYETTDIFTFQIAPSGDFADGLAMAQFHEQFMTDITGLPGVQSVGVVHELPLDEDTDATLFVTEGGTEGERTSPFINYTNAGGSYFEAMGIELISGRRFTRADHENRLGTAIVSEATANLLWPGEDPIGKRLRFASDSSGWETVVGVVENIRQRDFRDDAAELIYFPLVGREANSWFIHSPAYVVKTPRAEMIAAEIRALVRQTDPAAPMYAVHTMASLASGSMTRLSFTMLTLGIAAVLALVLGAVGLYGVLSYIVAQRAPEIGIRMAMGARAAEVRWMVVKQGSRLVLTGIFCGIAGSIAATQLLGNLLFGVEALDLFTFVTMSAVMLVVGILASYMPAQRASRIDPITSLRTVGN